MPIDARAELLKAATLRLPLGRRAHASALVAAWVIAVATSFDLRGAGATERVVVGASQRWPFAVCGQRLEAYWAVLFFAIHLLWDRN